MFRSSLLAALLLVSISTALAAQQPTEEQRAAVRTACRSDFIANCSSVEPGTKAALMCLVGNEAKLSPACRTAVNAITAKSAAPAHAPPPAAAEAPPSGAAPETPAPQAPPKAAAQEPKGDQLSAVRQACTLNDFIAHCSWIKPDSPEILLFLKAIRRVLAVVPSRGRIGTGRATPPAAQAQPAEGAPPAEAAPPPTRRRPGVAHPHVARAAVRSASGRSATQSRTGQGCAHRVPIRISWRIVAACSREAPKRCNVCRRIHRSSRLRAGAPSRRLPEALLLPEADPVGLQAARLAPRRNRWRARHLQKGRRRRRGRAGRESIRRQAHRRRVAAGEAQQPSPEQVSAIRAACRGDFRAYCRGVQPGGPRRCSVSSVVRRSSRLRAAVPSRRLAAARRRLEENWRAGRRTATGSWTGGRPTGWCCPIPPREAMFVLRACSADRYRLCGDVPPGGGRILMCLGGKRRERVARLRRRARRRTPLASRGFSRGPRYAGYRARSDDCGRRNLGEHNDAEASFERYDLYKSQLVFCHPTA